MIEFDCKCGGTFGISPAQANQQARCPYCNSTTDSSPVLVASLVSPENPLPLESGNRQGAGLLLLVLGIMVGLGLLLLIVGVGAYYWMSSPVADPVAYRPAAPAAPVEVAEVQNIDSFVGSAPFTKKDRQPPKVRSAGNSAPTVESANSSNRSGKPFRYQFQDNYEYHYSFALESKLRKKISNTGTVRYVGGKDSRSQAVDVEDLSAEIQKQNPMHVQCIANSSLMIDGTFREHDSKRWGLLVDDTGKIHHRDLYYGKKNESPIMPFLYAPRLEIGLVDFPDSGATSWKEKSKVELLYVSAEKTTRPLTEIERITGRFRSPHHRGFDPYQSPSDRYRSSILNRSRRGPLAGRDSPTTTTKTDVDVKTMQIDIQSTYELESESSDELVLKRTIEGVTTEASDKKAKLSRTEILTFDKKQNVLSKIDSTGETQITVDEIMVVLPIKFTVKLDRVLNPAEAAVRKRESEERAALANKKAEEARELRRLESAAKKKAKDEAAAAKRLEALPYIHAELPEGTASSMALSANGKFLLCGNYSEVSVYDTEKKQRVSVTKKLRDIGGKVESICVSPDGKQVLAGGRTGRIFIWNLDEDGQLEKAGEFAGHSSTIKSIAIDPTNQYVLSGEQNKVARLWNLKTQKEISAISEFESGVSGTGFTEGGKIGVACGPKNAIYIDVATGKIDRKRKGYRSHGYAHDITFSADGKHFAVSASDVEVFETDTASKLNTIKTPGGVAWKLALLNGGKHLVMGQGDVSVWNVENSTRVFEFQIGDHVNVQSATLSADGKYFCGINSLGGKRPITVFNTKFLSEDTAAVSKLAEASESGENEGKTAGGEATDNASLVHCTFPEQGWGVDSLCFSPDGRYLYAGKYGLAVYDVERKRTIDNHERFEAGSVTSIAASPDGKKVLVGLNSGRIMVWKTDKRGQLTNIGKFVGHASEISSISIGPNNRWVVSSGRKRAKIWDLKTLKEAHSIETESEVACRILPNAKAAIVGGRTGTKIFMIPEMTEWKNFDQANIRSSQATAVSLDGTRLAVSSGYKATLFNTQNGSQLTELNAGETIWSLAFHPDGKHLLAGGKGKVMIWDIETGTKVSELDVPSSYVQCLAISNDGKRIAAIPGSAGQKLTVFNTPTLD